jgi:hypothetical protein
VVLHPRARASEQTIFFSIHESREKASAIDATTPRMTAE